MAKPTFEVFVRFLLIPFEEWDDGRIFLTWVMKRWVKCVEVIGRDSPVPFYLCSIVGLMCVVGLSTVWFFNDVILFKCKVPLIFVIYINEYFGRYHFTCSFLLC